MLPIPSRGFSRSTSVHNVNLQQCCDWLEASVLFEGRAITGAEIVDLLHDEDLYPSQDFAWELLGNVWDQIQRRAGWIGKSYPIRTRGLRLESLDEWSKYVGYSFCLVLSLAESYPKWAQQSSHDYLEQGELFEAFTGECLSKLLNGWSVHQTGWTRKKAKQLPQVVSEVASLLGEKLGDLSWWASRDAHEEGLDLLCFRPFRDRRVGIPTYLFQCASGKNWKGKRQSPNLGIWKKAIIFAADPNKAFSLPFALSEEEFRSSCATVEGLLLDRHRLLEPGRNQRDWLSKGLSKRLLAWMNARIGKLPKH